MASEKNVNYWKSSMVTITNVDAIAILQNKNGPIPGEVICPVALVKLLDEELWDKQVHLEIWK